MNEEEDRLLLKLRGGGPAPPRLHRLRCDEVPRYKVGKKGGLTYRSAWSQIVVDNEDKSAPVEGLSVTRRGSHLLRKLNEKHLPFLRRANQKKQKEEDAKNDTKNV